MSWNVMPWNDPVAERNKAPMIDLYMWSTTNSWRASIGLEEFSLPYRVHPVNIREGDQFSERYTALTPYQKVPVMVDPDGPEHKPLTLFESGAILLYLAEKTGRCLGQNRGERVEIQKWFIFHMNSALPAFRFLMRDPEGVRKDVARVCHVIDSHLSSHRFFADSYSIADMALYPRIATIEDALYDVRDHRHIARWLDDVGGREAVIRGMAQPSCPHLGP